MTSRTEATGTCSLCHQSVRTRDLAPGELVRGPVLAEIHRDHPDWSPEQSVCPKCLNHYRVAHVRTLLEQEKGELTALEEQVIRSLREQESISENVNTEFETRLTFAEQLADRLTKFGGSWTFIIAFFSALLVWVVVNTFVMLAWSPFDPYPFILLNLVLSCLAAVQAPVIMMSQNRLEAKDRLRAELDYRVNLKAELEVRVLHVKIDQLLSHQWQRLLEIQQMQMELMEDLANHGIGTPRPRPGPR